MPKRLTRCHAGCVVRQLPVHMRRPCCSLASIGITVWLSRCLFCFRKLQMAGSDLTYLLQRSLFAGNESESDEYADATLVAVDAVIQSSSDLYLGKGFPGILSLSPLEVRGVSAGNGCHDFRVSSFDSLARSSSSIVETR